LKNISEIYCDSVYWNCKTSCNFHELV